jgi:hypothetical protein
MLQGRPPSWPEGRGAQEGGGRSGKGKGGSGVPDNWYLLGSLLGTLLMEPKLDTWVKLQHSNHCKQRCYYAIAIQDTLTEAAYYNSNTN